MTADGHAAPSSEQRALAAVRATGLEHRVVRHGRVSSLAEAAKVRGIEPRQLLKTIVVRRADDDYLFVLVPGDRQISWPKLRSLLGVSRLSMPDAATARDVTGYERGTITPFGSTRPWPVIADVRVPAGEVSLGAGGHGVGIITDGADLVAALDADVADVTEPVDDDEASSGRPPSPGT
ncbi:MAG TPA: YbaK/EbsC family protein [Actinomycetales bacterium]|nr:YbaK/EbsC family protein [Actinomycetales bacterium]